MKINGEQPEQGVLTPTHTDPITAARTMSPPGHVVEWRVHLARQRPHIIPPLLFLIAVASALAYFVFRHPLPVLAVVIALLASVSEFLLPIAYCITTEGITRQNGLSKSFLAWREVRRVFRDADGIKLSPLAHPSPLEAFRGIYLRTPADESVCAHLEESLRVYCPHGDPEPRKETSDVAG